MIVRQEPEPDEPFFGVDRSRPPERFSRTWVQRGFFSHVVAFLREIPSRIWWAWESTRYLP